MTAPASPIARAIAELEAEKANLAARAAKVDEAIASLRSLFHLPAPPVATKPRRVNGHRSHGSDGHGGETETAIRAALAHGPLSPMALSTAVGIVRPVLRIHVKRLEAAGAIVSSGTTASRRIALAGRPAKEAP